MRHHDQDSARGSISHNTEKTLELIWNISFQNAKKNVWKWQTQGQLATLARKKMGTVERDSCWIALKMLMIKPEKDLKNREYLRRYMNDFLEALKNVFS